MKRIVFFILTILTFNISPAQKIIEVERADDKCTLTNEKVDAGKVMFVFFSPKPLQIFHEGIALDAQKISDYQNGYQSLTIDYELPNGTIILKEGNITYELSYGQVMGARNIFPPVQNGKKYCFNITFKKSLSVSEDSNVDKKMQTVNDTDAEIILKVFPEDLDFIIKQKPYIEVLNNLENKEKGTYILLVKPNISDRSERNITIQRKGYADLVIRLERVLPKDYRIFNIRDENYNKGKITIKSIPSGATIEIKDMPISLVKTDTTLTLPPAKYHFTLTKQGYYSYEGTFFVGKDKKILAKLRPKLAYLNIPAVKNSQNTKVYIDGIFTGNIPINRHQLVEGKHTIQLKKDGYFTDKENYEFHIKEGETYSLSNYKIFIGGKVEVTSFPEKYADIYVDGKKVNKKTKATLFLPEGTHTIQVKKEGFLPGQKHTYVSGENSNFVIINMKVDEKYRRNREEKDQLNTLLERAKTGDPDAMYGLAKYYNKKYGGDPDYQQKILAYYTSAAQKGHSNSQRELALYYNRTGENKKAFFWFKKLATQGDMDAQFIVGNMYRTGEGTKKSKQQAKYWWHLSCNAGNARACEALQNLGKFGKGLLGIVGATLESMTKEAVNPSSRGSSGSNKSSNYSNRYNRSSNNRQSNYQRRYEELKRKEKQKEESLRQRYLKKLR